jgi:hypothetical protein
MSKGKTVWNRDEIAESIPLTKWQDPVEEFVLHFSERTCEVFFRCWDENGKPVEDTIGKLIFDRVWAVRSVRSEVCPHLKAFACKSCILEVKNSLWPREVDKYFYTDFSKTVLREKARHFIVKGHDIFHEILAAAYDEAYLGTNAPEFAAISKEL